MPAVDFVLLPKSACYRLNKHPSHAFPFFIIALEESLWKVMQMIRLVGCASQWHKVVAITWNPCKVNVNHLLDLKKKEERNVIPGRQTIWKINILGISGKVLIKNRLGTHKMCQLFDILCLLQINKTTELHLKQHLNIFVKLNVKNVVVYYSDRIIKKNIIPTK